MVEDQSDDLWGLAFLLLAVLAGLGIYGGVIGPAGHALRTGTADMFGLARYGLPPGFAVLAGYLILRHARSEPGRVAVGLALALLAAAGLLCVLTGKDTLRQPLAAMGRAGGLVGTVEGVPLQAGLASWGAGLVFGAAGFVACLIITATPVRAVAARLRSLCTAAGHAARWSWYVCKDLARGGQRLASAARHPSVRGPGLARRAAQPSRDVIDLAAPAAGPARLPVTSREPDWGAPAGRRAAQDDHAQDDNAEDDEASVDGSGVGGVRGDVFLEGVVAGGRAVAGTLGQPAPPPISITGLAGRGTVGPGKAQQLAIDLGLPREMSPVWRLPPMALLRRSKHTEVDRRQVEVLGQTLESALAAHGVETRLVAATVGPSVTRYELELGPGVKVQKVTALQRDIAYALAAADVRILAPIPGKSAIGVEVPNRQRQTVTLGDILSSPEAAAARHPLEVAAGRDIAGRPVLVNLAEMPHLLIAGATGSGKSSCINSMLTSLLMRATPDQVRLILVDPKRVELGHYTGLPHLLTAVVTNPKKAANALHWAVQEMERRYDLLAEVGMRDITGYNAAWDRGELAGEPEGGEPGLGDRPSDISAEGPGAEHAPVEAERASVPGYTRLPFIVVVVDELNDLMMVAARDVEESICRIAQMARAVGIHLVLATQRPSVDVITGLIKANIPSRLAFAVSSLADSRVVLDQPGAERLIGKGDMLLLTASSSQARRIQGPWADEEDIRKIVGHWRRQSGPSYVEGVDGPEGTAGGVGEDSDDDELLNSAMQLVVRSQLGSTSMLQRKLRVGFARAGRLMDLLEQRGVVGQSEGSKARAVLMTVDELEGP
ncbi:MAG TPA: DNA translocase FtsK [Acidimicrobiales bacterium]|nr:DNA translocase FtsK [Acidimicrobiales bacterium]